MLGRSLTRRVGSSAWKHAPGLRRLPFLKVLAAAEIALLARRHLLRLTPDERRQLVDLVRHGRTLSPVEKEELRTLVAKLEPRGFAGGAANRLSPVPLPKRLTREL